MIRRKRLQELTIKDNFMLGAVMLNEENCSKSRIRGRFFGKSAVVFIL